MFKVQPVLSVLLIYYCTIVFMYLKYVLIIKRLLYHINYLFAFDTVNDYDFLMYIYYTYSHLDTFPAGYKQHNNNYAIISDDILLGCTPTHPTSTLITYPPPHPVRNHHKHGECSAVQCTVLLYSRNNIL